jgi:hypothetical protein
LPRRELEFAAQSGGDGDLASLGDGGFHMMKISCGKGRRKRAVRGEG